MLAAAAYFDRESEEESEIRKLADELYRRADWRWAMDSGATLTHGWRPETGFLKYRWDGYDEALLAYVLAMGSPTHPLPPESYAAHTSAYEWKKIKSMCDLHGDKIIMGDINASYLLQTH